MVIIKRKKEIEEMEAAMSAFASMSEREARAAGYEGWGRGKEVKESTFKRFFRNLGDFFSRRKKEVEEKEEKSQAPFLLRLLLPFFVTFQAFFPGIIFGIGLSFIVVLIIVIITIVVLAYYTGAGIFGGRLILDIITPIAIVIVIFIITQLIGTPDYFSKAGKIPGGSLTVNVLFLTTVGFCGLIFLFCKSLGSVIVGTVILWIVLFIVLPFAITYSKPYSVCMKLPYISQYCNPREVMIRGPDVVNIPVRGGVGLIYGAPNVGVPSQTLYAGEPYEYTFTFSNYYSVPIKFTLSHSIVSRYGNGIKFNIVNFNQRINEFNRNTGDSYQDGVFVDPKYLIAEPVYGCPYWEWQITKSQGKPGECAQDKPCEDLKKSCVRMGYMECKCVGWEEATCSGASLYIETNVEHTGYFVGIANLYYSSVNVPPKPAYKLTQGPLSVLVEFQPNPYIGPVHYYRNDTSMYATFENKGGKITITSLSVTPLVTNITTIDKEKKKVLEELISVDKKECRESEIIGKTIPSGSEFSLMLCNFSAPYIKTNLRDLETGETIEINNVTFDRVLYYCNKIKTKNDKDVAGTVFWSSYWEKIYQGIDRSGLCEMLEKKDEDDKSQIVSDSLKVTMVKVEFNYTRKTSFSSSGITPYTRTEVCMNLK